MERRMDKVFAVYIAGAWGSSFGIARNISEGGMFLEAPDPYPLGGRMEITFSLPGSPVELTVIGEVVHLCFLNRTAGGSPRRPVVGLGLRFCGFLEPGQENRLEPAAGWLH
ncbi:MAG TPA: PilZ domain-containing protein [Myxococcota bacterium]|nr:PilZ domain-containing protein [Myxococcota bacterium]HRY94896.1 PilZ domain-containing protein [Myxococcota bacterium]